MKLDDSVRTVKGVGPKKEEKLNRRGITTVEDLLYTFPRTYEYHREIPSFRYGNEGDKVALTLKILGILPTRRKGNLQILSFEGEDREGNIGRVTFFNANYLRNRFKKGNFYTFYGPISYFGRMKTFTNPKVLKEWEKDEIEPVYLQREGIRTGDFKKMIRNALYELEEPEENLPLVLRKVYHLPARGEALQEIHAPTNFDNLKNARRRLVFEEFFFLQLGIFYLHSVGENRAKSLPFKPKEEMTDFFRSLPYSLTPGQEKVWREIEGDMVSGRTMNRLVQGDVGSGKTVIAVAALYLNALNGYQGVMMAPTEILARQHFESVRELLDGFGINTDLLVGSMTKKEKREVLERLASGETDILVGTHAVIQDTVIFKNPGLTVTDEQHRFGVRQRECLKEKGIGTHTLVMSATPIPRTLALTLYGDLDVSVIDTLPPGRQPIETIPIGEGQLEQAFDFIRGQLDSGRQAYFVCPLIEDSDKSELDAVEGTYKELSENILRDYSVALLHGKMKNEEKDEIINTFYENRIQALVSTTVIEVGVNVPNANIMFIYNAERFGLAQLHQLRGRVGRGRYKSWCFLYNTGNTEKADERMSILQRSRDGFYIAEKDMEMRGSGDFFGTRQHGFMELKIGDPVKDRDLFLLAQKEARRFHRRFPWEQLGDNPVRKRLLRMFESAEE